MPQLTGRPSGFPRWGVFQFRLFSLIRVSHRHRCERSLYDKAQRYFRCERSNTPRLAGALLRTKNVATVGKNVVDLYAVETSLI